MLGSVNHVYKSGKRAGGSPPKITLAFVGDICLGGSVAATLCNMKGRAPLERVQELFRHADVAIGNLECSVIAEESAPDSAHNVMVVPARLLDRRTFHPLKVLGLANNHVMDAGVSGLSATKDYLDRNRIASFGAGNNLHEAEALCVVQVKGMRVALLGACDVVKHYASATKPGVAPLILSRLVNRVRFAKAACDVVVVVLHADLEFSHHPSPSRKRLSRHLIDAGADAVIQHHPHVCQGIESYHNGVIAYSLGNFIFPVSRNIYMQRHAGTGWGVLAFIHVHSRGHTKAISWSIEPITIGEDNLPAPSVGSARAEQLRVLAKISQDLKNNRSLRRQWWKLCVDEARSTYYVLAHTRHKLGSLTMLKELLELLRDPYERRWMYGAISGGIIG